MNGLPTVCVDLDGVLAKYDGWKGIDHIGEPITGAVEFVRRLYEKTRVVIYTTRCKEYDDIGFDHRPAHELATVVRAWLEKYQIPHDEIYVGQGKPFAVGYIDDRAIQCRPQDGATYAQFGLAEATLDILLSRFKGQAQKGGVSEAVAKQNGVDQ